MGCPEGALKAPDPCARMKNLFQGGRFEQGAPWGLSGHEVPDWDGMIGQARLTNGFKVLTERIEHVRSVCVGLWVCSGSRDEPIELSGVSHFIEHLVFKGTPNRTAHQIAIESDVLGGDLDAFTTREYACFAFKVLDEHLERAFDILADLTLNPLFAQPELEKERGVIVEEIKMMEDSPEELISEIFTESFWKGHPLGRSISGTQASVNAITQQDVRDWYTRVYSPHNVLVTAAGNIDHEKFTKLVARYFEGRPNSQAGFDRSAPTPHAGIVIRNKPELEQSQLVIGVPSPSTTSEERFACNVLNAILGGSMSSRLFQSIREERGLAYSVSSGTNAYRDAGCFAIYAATSPERVTEVLELTLTELTKLKDELVPEEELQRSKDQFKAGIVLSLESSRSRMGRLAQQEMFFGKIIDIDEIVERIEAVTRDEVLALARRLFDPERISVAVLGPTNGFRITRDQLVC